MIDIHCHIVPGVDDGARNLEESIEMAKAAVEDGVHTIVATPHHRNNQFDNYGVEILGKVQDLNFKLEDLNIPMTILPGQEVRIHGDLMEGLVTKEILPVNMDTPYVLIELPTSNVPKYTNKLLYDLQVEGLTPVIVHPERNTELLVNPEKLYELVKSGVLTQVTAGSLVGNFGKKIRNFSHEIVRSNLAHFIASDAHNVNGRGFLLTNAFKEIEEFYGNDLVSTFLENAELMVNSKTIVGFMPEKIVRKKFLGIF